MSVDLNRLTAHLAPQQQEEVKKAYHRRAEHSTAAFLYCFFLGIFGAHRFYLRQWGKGLAHLIVPVLAAAAIGVGIALNWSSAIIALIVIPLLVIALIWEIINLFTIDAEVYQHNLKLAEQLVAQSLLADTTVERRGEAKLGAMLAADQTASAAASEQARAASDVAAETAAAPAPLSVAPAAAVEEVTASEVRDAAAAVSVGQYVETGVTQISDDAGTRPGDASEAQAQTPTSWSETESVRDRETAVASGAAMTAEEAPAAADAQGVAAEHLAAAEEQTADAEIVSYWDAVTRAHQQSGYTVTDSMERMETYGIGDAQDTSEAVVAETEPLPAPAEAAAATWPEDMLTDVTDAAVVPEEAPVEVLAAAPAPALAPQPAPAPVGDVTDMGFVAGEAKPVADVATEGGVPLSVALPGSDDVLVGIAGTIAAQPVAADVPGAAAADESVLVLVPDGGEPVSDAATTYEAPSAPPYVGEAATVAAMTGYAALSSDTPTLVPDQRDEAAQTKQPEGETLAELAGYSAESVAQHTEPPVQVAATAEAVPTSEAAAAAAAEAEYHATHSAEGEPGPHLMRRIRVVRQVKVEGQVVEETAAEEFIDADADPEPVRQRLQDMLRQQAGQQPGGGAPA